MIPTEFPYQITLASASPRRRQLIQQLGFEVKIQKIDVDELYSSSLTPNQVAKYLAEIKSDAYPSLKDGELLITADTLVSLNGRIIEKPASEIEAEAMLTQLSGTKHEVYSGVCLRIRDKKVVFSACTEVVFSAISTSQIHYYVQKFKPLDKAGAYGIQDWIGMIGVKQINGCYYNVMGLPLHKLYEELTYFV